MKTGLSARQKSEHWNTFVVVSQQSQWFKPMQWVIESSWCRGLSVLNFVEAIELLEALTDFQFKPSEKKPDFCVYDNQNQGYTLCVKANLVNAEYLKHIKATAESRKLGLRESQGYLVIYGP